MYNFNSSCFLILSSNYRFRKTVQYFNANKCIIVPQLTTSARAPLKDMQYFLLNFIIDLTK